ncbi:hypothetical protein ABZ477_14520 [Microbacterium sp. NPDC019599]|uniref:hypothetical protein n=1 Tax=Microbacterium sp. NPDC019599 TaxID=3154690 RepID=UPI0033EC8896
MAGRADALTYVELDSDLDHEVRERLERGVAQCIGLRRALDAPDRARLDSIASWPLELVTDGDTPVGWLVPTMPDSFFLGTDTWRRPGARRPQLLEWLSATPAQALVAGFRVDSGDAVLRLAVLANLVHAVATLHKLGIVFGDLSLRSVAFSAVDARVRLLDCHAAAAAADVARHQRNSPYYLAPECQAVGVHEHARGNPHIQDQATDVYKLALCIVRGLSEGRGVPQLKTAEHLADVLDADTVSAVNGALSADPVLRPPARALYSHLSRCLERLTEPPEIADFRALSTVVPRGSDLLFTWEVRNATATHLRGPNGFSMPVDPEWGYCAVPITHSGIFALEASKRGVTTVQRSSFVTAFDLPEFDLADVCERIVEIPSLEPVELGTVFDGVPRRPSVEIGSDFVPSVTIPPVTTLTTAIATMTERMSSSFSVAEAVKTLTGADVGHLRLPTIDALRFDVTEVDTTEASAPKRAPGKDTPKA